MVSDEDYSSTRWKNGSFISGPNVPGSCCVLADKHDISMTRSPISAVSRVFHAAVRRFFPSSLTISEVLFMGLIVFFKFHFPLFVKNGSTANSVPKKRGGDASYGKMLKITMRRSREFEIAPNFKICVGYLPIFKAFLLQGRHD